MFVVNKYLPISNVLAITILRLVMSSQFGPQSGCVLVFDFGNFACACSQGSLSKVKPWQSEETCCQNHLLRTRFPNVSQFCQTRKTVSSRTICFYFRAEKHNLLLKTVFTLWQNWETLGKDVSAANVSGNMFARFARAYDCPCRSQSDC